MAYNDILKLPYITFVLSMADAPQIDYDSKKQKKDEKTVDTAEEQINAITAALR